MSGPAAAGGSSPEIGEAGAAGRVLIVDDNADLVGALQAVLRSVELPAGHGAPAGRLEIVTAGSGADGLGVARARGFDVAIVDMKLPDGSGLDLIEPLRAAAPFAEVILITGFATMAGAMGAVRSGAYAFLPKSFHPEELLSTVQQAVAKVRLRRERRALEKRAADAEALSAMGTLAMHLAHEIRNPLNAAVLQLHMLGRDVDKLEVDEGVRGKLHRRARVVESEIGRLSRLLTEFLELARPRGIAREPVQVGTLVDAVLDLERDAAAARGVQVLRHLADEGCVALGDTEKLKQVVLNLVVNALEAMKEGGTLTVTVTSEGEWARIAVEDTGPGIDPQVLGSIFDPFFTTKEAGTGLGLSIVRKIVDQHAGEVRLESERGRGTRVTVAIPLARALTKGVAP